MALKETAEQRLEALPAQKGKCGFCVGTLHPWQNEGYDNTAEGFCNRLCRKAQERKEETGE